MDTEAETPRPKFLGQYPIRGLTSIGQSLYAMDSVGNVYRSTNYGDTWTIKENVRTKRFVASGEVGEERAWVAL
jgi:hypothetical protein